MSHNWYVIGNWLKTRANTHWILCSLHHLTQPTMCYSHKVCKLFAKGHLQNHRQTQVCFFVAQALFLHLRHTGVGSYEEPTPAMLLCQEQPPSRLITTGHKYCKLPGPHKQETAVANFDVLFSCFLCEKKRKEEKSWDFKKKHLTGDRWELCSISSRGTGGCWLWQ